MMYNTAVELCPSDRKVSAKVATASKGLKKNLRRSGKSPEKRRYLNSNPDHARWQKSPGRNGWKLGLFF
jgi:hypothetical protein